MFSLQSWILYSFHKVLCGTKILHQWLTCIIILKACTVAVNQHLSCHESWKCWFFTSHFNSNHRYHWLRPDLSPGSNDLEKSNDLNLTWALLFVLCVCAHACFSPLSFPHSLKDPLGDSEAILQTNGRSRHGANRVCGSRRQGLQGWGEEEGLCLFLCSKTWLVSWKDSGLESKWLAISTSRDGCMILLLFSYGVADSSLVTLALSYQEGVWGGVLFSIMLSVSKPLPQ